MPEITVFDQKGNPVRLEAIGHGLYVTLDADGNPTSREINLATALQCNSLFTEEQHERFVAKQKKAKKNV